MTPEERRESSDLVYQVTAGDEYAFGGDTNINVLVDEETEDTISGWIVGRGNMVRNNKGERVTVVKSNLAGWREVPDGEKAAARGLSQRTAERAETASETPDGNDGSSSSGVDPIKAAQVGAGFAMAGGLGLIAAGLIEDPHLLAASKIVITLGLGIMGLSVLYKEVAR